MEYLFSNTLSLIRRAELDNCISFHFIAFSISAYTFAYKNSNTLADCTNDTYVNFSKTYKLMKNS